MTSIVNLYNVRQNLKEWMNCPDNFYIGRAGILYIDGELYPKMTSPFYNPFRIGAEDDIMRKYKIFLKGKLSEDSNLFNHFLALKDKCLGCMCNYEYCHGNVIIDLINQLYSENAFHRLCTICNGDVTELTGYMCLLCDNVWCFEHNEKEYVCNCPKMPES